ncbi:SH3 domain-containing protein [Streptomyces sp. NPDC003860]
MRSARTTAISVAVLGLLAVPLTTAPTAQAAPQAAPQAAEASTPASSGCLRPGDWYITTKALTIRSKATTNSTALGVLYDHQYFVVHQKYGKWYLITNRATGVKGYVSTAYVRQDIRMCLN